MLPDIGIVDGGLGLSPVACFATCRKGRRCPGRNQLIRRRSRRGHNRTVLGGGNEGPTQLLRATKMVALERGGSPFSSFLNPRIWGHMHNAEGAYNLIILMGATQRRASAISLRTPTTTAAKACDTASVKRSRPPCSSNEGCTNRKDCGTAWGKYIRLRLPAMTSAPTERHSTLRRTSVIYLRAPANTIYL